MNHLPFTFLVRLGALITKGLPLFILILPIQVEALPRPPVFHKDRPPESVPTPTLPFVPLHRQGDTPQPFQPQLLPQQTETETQAPVAPSLTIITPSGYGADWGDAAIGIGLQGRTRYTQQADGVLGFKVGFGDSQEAIGLEIGLTLVDLDHLLQDGFFSWKLHRVLPANFSVAVGMQGVGNFGESDAGTSIYGVVTKGFTLSANQTEIHLSFGVGTGSFRSESNVQQGIESLGIFGSVAVGLNQSTRGIIEWTGQDLTLGMSFVPFRHLPIVITPAIADVTGSAGDGARFIFSAGYLFSF